MIKIDSRATKVAIILLQTSVSIGFIYYLSNFELIQWDLSKLTQTLAIPVLLVVFTTTTALSAMRYSILSGHKDLKKIFEMCWASQAIGLFWGFGSDVARTIWFKQKLESKWFKAININVAERLVSFTGLIVLLTVFWALQYTGTWILLALVPFAFGPIRIIGLAIAAHGLKLLAIFYIISTFTEWPGIHVSPGILVGLLVDALPIQWEGVGLSHWTFHNYFSESIGANVFNIFLFGKVLFKAFGFLLVVRSFKKEESASKF